MTDLNTLTVKELEEHIVEAQRILEKKKVEQVKDSRKKIKDYAASLGVRIDEIFGNKAPKKKATTRKRNVLYIDDTGKEFYRALKEWTPEQREKYKQNV